MLHSVALAVPVAVLLIGDLSARWGLWCSDAAGVAQCGSGEAVLYLLLSIPHSLSPSSLLLIPLPPPFYSLCSFYTVLSVILHCLSPSPFSRSPSCFFPLLLLSSFVTSGSPTKLYGEMNRVLYKVLLLSDAVTLSVPALEVDASK